MLYKKNLELQKFKKLQEKFDFFEFQTSENFQTFETQKFFKSQEFAIGTCIFQH